MGTPLWNPPNRFVGTDIDWEEPPPPAHLEVREDDAQGALSRNDSPDVGFEWSVNPYRGCTHGCAFCYARPTHEYLGLGAGTDFERVVVVKRRAAELLREAFEKPSWVGKPVVFSGVTDCYQPLERTYGITRACLEVCAAYRNPVGIITRAALVARDLDVLERLHGHGAVRVTFSLSIPDPVVQRAIEPGAPPPEVRLRAMKVLADAGIPVGVSVAPVIPGLNDHMIPEALKQARAHGARWAWLTALRLPGAVAPVFERRVRDAFPDRADRVMNAIRRMRNGGMPSVDGAEARVNDSRFGARMRGEGPAWDAAERLFEIWRDKLGYEPPLPAPDPSPFRRPGRKRQLELFE